MKELLERIFDAIIALKKHVKLAVIATIILGAIPAYYAIIDHRKKSDIEILKDDIRRNIAIIDSIFPKEPYKISDYGLYKINYIEKQLTWTQTDFIKGKDLDAIKEFVDAVYKKNEYYISESAECIDAWSDDLFDISIHDNVDSLRKNRNKLTNYYHSLCFDIEDALLLKFDRAKYHYSLITDYIKQENREKALEELDNWMNDIDYYKYDKMILDLVISTAKLPYVNE